MEMMNYNKRGKKNSKVGLFGFILFTVVGTSMVFYMINNEPKPVILGENMYIPVGSENVDGDSNSNGNENDNEVSIYTEEYLKAIKYNVKQNVKRETDGNMKLNLSVPSIYIDGEPLSEINNTILAKFIERYDAVKAQSGALENKFTYKVTHNTYESMLNGRRVLSFTLYERTIDDMTGEETRYKLYGLTVDLATKQILTQDDIGPTILGNTYKNEIKSAVKEHLITKKIYKIDNYSYTMTGMEEFYVKDGKLHIMFNPGELKTNKDYIDIVI